MDRRDLPRRRLEGYYEGSSGRRSQYEWDDLTHDRGEYQSFGNDARWINEVRAEHLNNDQFGNGISDRRWRQNIDNRGDHRNHFGKGPKGYSRSQERIFEDVCEALTRNHDVDASQVEVSVEGSVVTLTGTVESRRIKRLAEDITDAVLGVDDVINLLSMLGEGSGDQIKVTGAPLGENQREEPHRDKRS